MERNAFLGLHTDAHCSVLGAQTRGAKVLQEAVTWAKVIGPALVTYVNAVAYTPLRFTWFLECARNLGAALAAQDQADGVVSDARSVADHDMHAGLLARASLYTRLKSITGTSDPAGSTKLEQAHGTAEKASELVTSLNALTAIASDWLAGTTPGEQALVASAGLAQSQVDAATTAVTALTGSAGDAMGGRLAPHDTPAVNVLEGRLLCEMKTVMDAFAAARVTQPSVPSLTPGKGTRDVLGTHPRKKGTAAPPAPTPSTSAATTPAATPTPH